jgi:hypothetical protein
MVTERGGLVSSADGNLRLLIPDGALTGPVEVSITAITNQAPGAVRSYRLKPDAVTFVQPIELQFRFAEDELDGTTPEAFRVATQNTERQWAFVQGRVDVINETVTVSTAHFSDWSLLKGWQIRPGSARVKVGTRQPLSVQYCAITEVDGLTGLVPECTEDEDVVPILKNWAVNAITGGNASVGTVMGGTPSAVYAAPGEVPMPALVAVSVSLDSKPPALLISNITVVKDELPNKLEGTLTYESKVGGPGTQTSESRVKGTAQVTFVPWPERGEGVYRMSGPFTLTDFFEELPNCNCMGSGGSGSLLDADNALSYKFNGLSLNGQYNLSWSVTGKVGVTCTKKDPNSSASCPSERPWFASGSTVDPKSPNCDGNNTDMYMDPRSLNGVWAQTCRTQNNIVTKSETFTWSLSGR